MKLARARLRTRILLGVLAVTAVAFAAFDAVAVTELRGYLIGRSDATLRAVLDLSGPRLDRLLRAEAAAGEPAVLRQSLGNDEYLGFFPAHGAPAVLQAAADLTPMLPSDLPALAAGGRGKTVSASTGHSQFRIRAVSAGDGTLVAGVSLDEVDRTTNQLSLIVILGSAAAIVLIGLGVLFIVRRGLRPLAVMAAQADRISAGDLTERVTTAPAGTETGRLASALNDMLTRIEAAVAQTQASQELVRRFFADASHELRTPLASLRANAELYQQGALTGPADVDEAMRRIGIEAQRMSGLVDDMLRLARLDQHPEQRRDPVDLTAVLAECVERARIAAPDHQWNAQVQGGLVVAGDEELLRRGVDNLIANVTAHTPAGTAATVTARLVGTSVTVEVSDDGPGVMPEQLPHIFDRFYRGAPQSRGVGSGLGLAIVAEIAAVHGGTAAAARSEPRGLRVALLLPAWPRAAESG